MNISGKSIVSTYELGHNMFDATKKKYDKMIYHLLHHFHIQYDFDEYYQLALIKLWELEKTYNAKLSPNKDQYIYLKLKFYLIDLIRARMKYNERFELTDTTISTNYVTHDAYSYIDTSTLTEAETLWLKLALEGYKLSEIAKIFGKSTSYVKNIRRSARCKLHYLRD